MSETLSLLLAQALPDVSGLTGQGVPGPAELPVSAGVCLGNVLPNHLLQCCTESGI